MRNMETRDPEILRFKDKIVILSKTGLKSHNLERLWAKEEIIGIVVKFLEGWRTKKQIKKIYPTMGF